MPRNRKKDFDAADYNKDQYIKENYIVKEEDAQKGANNQRNIIAIMLSVLLVCLIFVLVWTFFINPEPEQVEVQVAVTDALPTPSPTIENAVYSTPTPRPHLQKYVELEGTYPDVVGWISIENIKVNYPVVQSPDPADPFKYLDKGPDEKTSESGAIFLDIRNSIDAKDMHTVIYGHNMKNGSMFGQLDKYMSKSFFDDHRIIRYDTLYQELEWEVFNVFITTVDFYYIQTYFMDDSEFVNLMTQCINQSYYNNNNTQITPEDHVLTLSTCTNGDDDERLVIQARLITPLEGEEINTEETPNP